LKKRGRNSWKPNLSSKRNREVKNLESSINYDIRGEGQSSRGKCEGRGNNVVLCSKFGRWILSVFKKQSSIVCLKGWCGVYGGVTMWIGCVLTLVGRQGDFDFMG
jgi:hypothetical protein